MKTIGVLATLAVVCFLCPDSLAQCGHYTQAYHYPVQYAHQVYQPYYPVKQYHYNYDYKPDYKEIVLVPLVQKVAVTPDYYFSVRDYYKDSVQLEMLRLQRELLQRGLAPQTPQAQPGVQAPVGAAAPAREVAVQTAVTPVLAQLISTRCVNCHGGAKTAGKLDLKDPATVPAGVRWHCVGRCRLGEMPEDGNPLNESELKELEAWAKAASSQARK